MIVAIPQANSAGDRPTMTLRRLALAGLMMLSAPVAIAANEPAEPAPASPPAVAAPEPPTAFDPDLLRLTEIAGALTMLDAVCGGASPAIWRDKIRALIEAQQMGETDRRRYVDAFNRGYRTFAAVRRDCTEQTAYARQRYLDEGAALAARLGERFGRGAPGTP